VNEAKRVAPAVGPYQVLRAVLQDDPPPAFFPSQKNLDRLSIWQSVNRRTCRRAKRKLGQKFSAAGVLPRAGRTCREDSMANELKKLFEPEAFSKMSANFDGGALW